MYFVKCKTQKGFVQQTLDLIDFQCIQKNLDFFVKSSFVLHRRKKIIQVWNNENLTMIIFIFGWTIF